VHEPALVATIALALGAALVAGYAARRAGLSPILGYLVAGVAVGPYTPGFVADVAIASQLAEVGVVLLMFGVGLHFSLRELWAVRSIAIPGALIQSAVATVLGLLVARASGWSLGAGLVLGLSLSVASTVVLVRGLMDVGLLESPAGHAAVGWLVVEDLLTVLILVVLPALAGPLGGVDARGGSVGGAVALAFGKVAALGLVVFTVGSRVVPWLLVRVARAGSRELFTLAVLAVALGIAYGSAAVFDVSIALGAFLAGMVVAQSDLSHRAAAEALPLRDAFAVLFFVSVGMLFDPSVLAQEPGLVLATLGVVLLAKPLTALVLVLALRYPARTAVTAAFGLAQVGEFSFILANLGSRLGLFPKVGSDLVLAAALLSIAVNPFLMRSIRRVEARLSRVGWLERRRRRRLRGEAPERAPADRGVADHAILCGHGRVGSVLAELLRARGLRYVVVEEDRNEVERLRARGVEVVEGDAANPMHLEHAGLRTARVVLIALSDPVATRLVATHVVRERPGVPVLARVESEPEREGLRALGGVEPVVGTLEAALEMGRRLLESFGTGPLESQAAVIDLRRRHGGGPSQARERFAEIAVPAGTLAAGRSIAALRLPREALIVLVRRRGAYVVPRGETALEPGDAVLALGDPDALEAVRSAVAAPSPAEEPARPAAGGP